MAFCADLHKSLSERIRHHAHRPFCYNFRNMSRKPRARDKRMAQNMRQTEDANSSTMMIHWSNMTKWTRSSLNLGSPAAQMFCVLSNQSLERRIWSGAHREREHLCMNEVSVSPAIKRSARSKPRERQRQRCYFNSPFSSDLYRFRKYAGGHMEGRFRRRGMSIRTPPSARWVAASATAKFTTLNGIY